MPVIVKAVAINTKFGRLGIQLAHVKKIGCIQEAQRKNYDYNQLTKFHSKLAEWLLEAYNDLVFHGQYTNLPQRPFIWRKLNLFSYCYIMPIMGSSNHSNACFVYLSQGDEVNSIVHKPLGGY